MKICNTCMPEILSGNREFIRKKEEKNDINSKTDAMSLDLLANQGIAQVNMSFKGNLIPPLEMPEDEFINLKDTFIKNIFDWPIHKKYKMLLCYNRFLNKNNVKTANIISSDERLYNNEQIIKNMEYFLLRLNNHDIKDFAERILTNDELLNSKPFVDNAIALILNYDNDTKSKIIDKILSDENLYNNQIFMDNAISMIEHATSPKKEKIVDEIISNEKLYNNINFMKAAGNITDSIYTEKQADVALAILSNPDIEQTLNKVENYRKIMLIHPELYLNGEYKSKNEAEKMINYFVNSNYYPLILSASILDKETINAILRNRFSGASNYFDTINKYNFDDIILLLELQGACNLDGKPFMPTQKLQFIDIIESFKESNVDPNEIKKLIVNGKIDISEINIYLFQKLLKNLGLDNEQIFQTSTPERILTWDLKYFHLFAASIPNTDSTVASDIFNAAISQNFNEYIHNPSNLYGQANLKTKAIFENNGLNYAAWLNPSDSNNIHLQVQDSNIKKLNKIAARIKSDVEVLRLLGAKNFIDKQLNKYIRNDEFTIPYEYTNSKTKLSKLTDNILKQLDSVFTRAQNNINNPEKKQVAQKTLEIQDRLKTRLKELRQIEAKKFNQNLDLTIKMWDRIPQKDLFQGNYSTCCIGMGECNADVMFNYITNTAFNMIEISNHNEVIGNALCYFVKDRFDDLLFVIDNIEINNKYQLSDEEGINVRNAIIDYADNVAKEVTNKNNTEIYMGIKYNDVPINDLHGMTMHCKFLGDIHGEDTYLDTYGGWIADTKLHYPNELTLFFAK